MSGFTFRNTRIAAISVAVPEVKKNTLETVCSASGLTADLNIRLNDLLVRTVPENQTTADLGFIAANAIMNKKSINQDQLAFLVFITSTPDYRSPATAAVLHNRLGLTEDCACFDINSGGTGFIQGLQIGCSMLLSSNKEMGIIITGDTTSMLLNYKSDQNNLFGDGCSAILLEKCAACESINLFSATGSNHFRSLINPAGGFRHLKDSAMNQIQGFTDSPDDHLFLDMASILDFSERAFNEHFERLLSQSGNAIEDFNLIVSNHENEDLKERLKSVLNLSEKQPVFVQTKFGFKNGATAPLIITSAVDVFNPGLVRTLLIASGEGLSWGFADFTIDTADIIPVIETSEYYTEGGVTHEM